MTGWNKETAILGSTYFWKPETGSHKEQLLDDGNLFRIVLFSHHNSFSYSDVFLFQGQVILSSST
jgi:hypothetical protein